MTIEQIVRKKLTGEWYSNLGFRERKSVVHGVRVQKEPNNPGIFTVNGYFQITYKMPGYPDGTVVG
jgi:hypothetical protein